MAKEMFEKMIVEIERIKTILVNSQTSGKLPEIERDLMLAKLRNIYEFLLLYQPDLVEEKSPTKKKNEIDIIENNPSFIEINKAETIHKEEPENIEIKEHKTESPLPKQSQSEKSSIITGSSGQIPILADVLGASAKAFLYDVIKQYGDNNYLAKQFQNSPINNIAEAIGINEKFLFIRELFNNDKELYQSTIDKLNQASGFNEAIEYIATNFSWDFENPTVHRILELIRRRHSENV